MVVYVGDAFVIGGGEQSHFSRQPIIEAPRICFAVGSMRFVFMKVSVSTSMIALTRLVILADPALLKRRRRH